MPSSGGKGTAGGSTPAGRSASTPSGTPARAPRTSPAAKPTADTGTPPSGTPQYSGPVELLSTHEIARLLGLSRQRVQQLTKEPGFPPPAATLNMGSVWHTADVRAWATANDRPLTG